MQNYTCKLCDISSNIQSNYSYLLNTYEIEYAFKHFYLKTKTSRYTWGDLMSCYLYKKKNNSLCK